MWPQWQWQWQLIPWMTRPRIAPIPRSLRQRTRHSHWPPPSPWLPPCRARTWTRMWTSSFLIRSQVLHDWKSFGLKDRNDFAKQQTKQLGSQSHLSQNDFCSKNRVKYHTLIPKCWTSNSANLIYDVKTILSARHPLLLDNHCTTPSEYIYSLSPIVELPPLLYVTLWHIYHAYWMRRWLGDGTCNSFVVVFISQQEQRNSGLTLRQGLCTSMMTLIMKPETRPFLSR